jgi:Ca2+-binding RTX toxin-like protein
MPVINGTAGRDVLGGTTGADTISGGEGGDTLNGGAGDDVLYGFGASDLSGGAMIDATLIASGLSRPVFAASPPGDPDRLFVIEQHTGLIRILDLATGTVAATPFLDINGINTGSEEGLLGLAFHPDYASNGLYYVYLTNTSGNIEIWEYTRGASPDISSTTRELVLTFDHPGQTNHNGGWMAFGPDGYLYIATGDGGGAGDPDNSAQDINSLLGKILRIDVDGDDFPANPNANYAIPDGNPYVGINGADEVFAIGLRNPWRNSFDSLTGDLIIADVGQSLREEVNFVPAGTLGGRNFGWAVMEGTLVFDGTRPGNPPPGSPLFTDPIYEYAHGSGPNQGFSITGGYVVRGPDAGAQGLYIFADFVTGNIWTLRPGETAEDVVRRNLQIVANAGTVNQIASFAVDGSGRIYVLGLDGDIHRLTFTAGAGDGADTIYGASGIDQIYGGVGDDSLYGGDGSDLLDGGLGADLMIGNFGDDAYAVDNTGDVVSEGSAGGGVDQVTSSVTFSLAATGFADHLTLTGASAINGTGNALANTILGNSAANTLNGLGGNDTLSGGAGNDALLGGDGVDNLDGGAGADVMIGNFGDDTYVVDNAGDTVSEGSSSGGTDHVLASVSFNLGPTGFAENLTLTGAAAINGTGNNLNNVITGNGAANTLLGGGGNDTLDGGAGADAMIGNTGDDMYVVDNAGDTVSEGSSTGGTDHVFASVSFNLGPTGFAENLTLTGAGTISGTGNSLANAITGNNATNTLSGNQGDDTLDGGLGADALIGGAGADEFVFSSALGGGNVDAVSDFSTADDTIVLDAAVFTALSVGALPAGAFHVGASAGAADDRIIYDSATGALYYDEDGAGGAAQIQFATLAAGLALTSADFIVSGP